VSYILDHSGAKLILVDHQFLHLVKEARVPVVVCHDTGRTGDPYEEFLKAGRNFSVERGWLGLDVEADEDASAVLCYTFVVSRRCSHINVTDSLRIAPALQEESVRPLCIVFIIL
jgi:hypothetical protein